MVLPHIKTVKEKDFADEVYNSALPVMIEFYSDWCGPCKSFLPRLEKLAADHQKEIKVIKVNIDECPELAKRFGISRIPALVVTNDGRIVGGAVGNMSRTELNDLLKRSLPRLFAAGAPKPPKPPVF